MGKIEDYRQALLRQDDWETFLLAESNLPGPRANLELVQAAADVGDETTLRRLIASEIAALHPAGEFMVMCGMVGLGRLLAEGDRTTLKTLREYASDSRWRVREAVAMALQRWGDADMAALVAEMEDWARGNLLERRAAAAALCEPRLLRQPQYAKSVLHLLNVITTSLLNEKDRRNDDFKTLRKALGYCWSVAIVALPEAGKAAMEQWFGCADKDIHWILSENLKKDRLSRMDAAWVEQARTQLA